MAMSRTFSILARVALALAFLTAGVLKLSRPEVFAVTIKAFGLLPEALIMPLSVGLPMLEIAAALLLFCNRRPGLELVTALLLLFVATLAYALRMGLDIDCGCYGPSDPEREAFGSIRQALWRDAAMLCCAAFLFWRRRVIPQTPEH
jgi:uncharacterized membrane protein YphA (DoxX/SURF4 family)